LLRSAVPLPRFAGQDEEPQARLSEKQSARVPSALAPLCAVSDFSSGSQKPLLKICKLRVVLRIGSCCRSLDLAADHRVLLPIR
jgi:hypothetical protein